MRGKKGVGKKFTPPLLGCSNTANNCANKLRKTLLLWCAAACELILCFVPKFSHPYFFPPPTPHF